jgi:regulator of protease activity HflC (stomatin/prohibitin superfamily)
MELLSIPRRQREIHDSFTEELLGKEQFEDEFHEQGGVARRQRRRERRRGKPLTPFQTPPSMYRPPVLIQGSELSNAHQSLELESYLFLNGPPPPSIRRSLQRQTPRQVQGSLVLDHHVNPAKDLAGIFSYGACCCQCVRTQEVGITENFGQFQQVLPPGFYCLSWPFSDIAGRLSLRIQQIDLVCETKTKDDVFVHLQISVQYRVVVEKSFDAYYRLTDPSVQLKSYVFDVVRSTVPKMTIDQLFSSKQDIADAVFSRLATVMNEYGYEIITSLVTDVMPTQKVRDSMNEVEACRRLKEAMPHRAEAEKTRIVKKAEADADSMYLRGCGTARNRRAVAQGLKASVETLSQERCSKDVMDLLLLTQYIDMLGAVGGNQLIISHTPGNVESLRQSLPTTHNVVDLLS